ncbi:thiamine-triphosphatase-like [Tropilaelaps mercedesae]|uniref:Thiamine-triphosphatase-like n=1 Tax=Tropilaelaps mercedesae TaxID=418985 RepID=A0A1V9XJF8_9ACAR|nr:thiamine-triphosphatase-like [Tropilaelaps mercedesae]
MEVERKFRLPEGTDIVESFGPLVNGESFTKKKASSFVDEYFDTDDHQLSAKDAWLRRRDHGGDMRWELKYSPSFTMGPSRSLQSNVVTKYVELTDEAEIASVVCRLLNIPQCVLSALIKSSLNMFCQIDTLRETYELNVLECSYIGTAIVVIDRALGGAISLGEVELQLDRSTDKEQLDNAEKAINAIVARFGLESVSEGKMEYLIRTRKPQLWSKLYRVESKSECN